MKKLDRAFTLLVAKNEQRPLWDDGIKLVHFNDSEDWDIEVRYATLGVSAGDITIAGYESRFCVERKSGLDEIAQNICRENARMQRQFMRMRLCERALIAVQGSPTDIAGGLVWSHMNPDSLRAALNALTSRGIGILWCTDRDDMRKQILDAVCMFIREDFRLAAVEAKLAEKWPEHFPPIDKKGDPRWQPAKLSKEAWVRMAQRVIRLEGVVKELIAEGESNGSD